MKKEIVQQEPIKLIGITVRTNNHNEMQPETSKIAEIAGRYMSQGIAERFVNRSKPGVTYCAYTDYESDENGDYTYFIGEEVHSFSGLEDSDYVQLEVPRGQYQKFTTPEGKMPDVVIAAWQSIWAMQEKDLGGKRLYHTDFEIYDERASDPNDTVLDIYIGIV